MLSGYPVQPIELRRSGALPLDPATLPPTRICALLVVQDRTSIRHHGIDLLDGHPLHTTVTQSICKRLYFRTFSKGSLRYRKLMLMGDAWAFDLRVPKQKQLQLVAEPMPAAVTCRSGRGGSAP